MEEILEKAIESAKKTWLSLSVLTIASFYIIVFGNLSEKESLRNRNEQREQLTLLRTKCDSVFKELSDFYEGPAEDEKLNFSSFIYALEISDFQLNSIGTKPIKRWKWCKSYDFLLERKQDLNFGYRSKKQKEVKI